MRRDCSIGVGRQDVLDSGCHVADRAQAEQGAEEQNVVVLTLAVAFFVIMLLELDERSPQRTFPEQDQMGDSSLTDRTQRSAKAFKFGLRGGSRRPFTPPTAKVSRNSAQNLVSRSCNT